MTNNELIVQQQKELQEGCALHNADEYVMEIIDGAYQAAQHETGFIPEYDALYEQLVSDLYDFLGYTNFYGDTDEERRNAAEFLSNYVDNMGDSEFFDGFLERNRICVKIGNEIVNDPQMSFFALI